MRFNFDTTIKRLNGVAWTRAEVGMPKTSPEQSDDEYKADPLTLADFIVHCLLDVTEIESRDQMGRAIPKRLEEREKFERYRIAEAIYDRGVDGVVDLKVEQITTIKKCVDVGSNVEIMGRVFRFFEHALPEPVKEIAG